MYIYFGSIIIDKNICKIVFKERKEEKKGGRENEVKKGEREDKGKEDKKQAGREVMGKELKEGWRAG